MQDPSPNPASQTPTSEPVHSPADGPCVPGGNGKISRLPEEVRKRINQMLVDCVPYKDILNRIGEHAAGISVDNVTKYKANGFQRWLRARDTKQEMDLTREEAADLTEHKPAAAIQDATRALASGQVYELLKSFDPRTFAGEVATKPDLYLRLLTSVARISEAESLCNHRRVQQALAELKLDRPEAYDPKTMYTGEQLKNILRQIKIL